MSIKICENLGKRIQYYRKQRKISVEELAKMLGKTPATIYKYESGAVEIDVSTLYLISVLLDVSFYNLTCFLDEVFDFSPISKISETIHPLYLYHYDGIREQVFSCMIRFVSDEQGQKNILNLYYNIPGGQHYTNAQCVYSGTVNAFDYVVYFDFQNIVNRAEIIHIVAFNPWKSNMPVWGVLTGIALQSFSPSARKILISKDKIDEKYLTKKHLAMTKEELDIFSDTNILSIVSPWKYSNVRTEEDL